MTFPPAFEITQMSNAGTQADNALRGTIAAAIYTATETGARTTGNITWTTVTEDSLLIIEKELEGLGYTVVSNTTSTIAVSWS
jgi:hypothetical protein